MLCLTASKRSCGLAFTVIIDVSMPFAVFSKA